MQRPLVHHACPGDPEPTWHQVAKPPELAAIITKHQGHVRTCSCCGYVSRGVIPPKISAHVIEPRMAATMSYFAGRHHLGPWSVEEIVETVFEAPTSAGLDLHAGSRDERCFGQSLSRGWRGFGQEHRPDRLEREELEARALGSGYRDVRLRRDPPATKRRRPSSLAGLDAPGILRSDHRGAYSKLPLERRQICRATYSVILGAHPERDSQKLIDLGTLPARGSGRFHRETDRSALTSRNWESLRRFGCYVRFENSFYSQSVRYRIDRTNGRAVFAALGLHFQEIGAAFSETTPGRSRTMARSGLSGH